MWISSFVVTLPAAEESAAAVQRALVAIPVFTLGERQAARLPVVLEAPDGSTARYWHEWVEQLPGVIQVEVAFVSFDESERQPEPATIESMDSSTLRDREPAIGIGDERHA